jgi:hypothetical protein
MMNYLAKTTLRQMENGFGATVRQMENGFGATDTSRKQETTVLRRKIVRQIGKSIWRRFGAFGARAWLGCAPNTPPPFRGGLMAQNTKGKSSPAQGEK